MYRRLLCFLFLALTLECFAGMVPFGERRCELSLIPPSPFEFPATFPSLQGVPLNSTHYQQARPLLSGKSDESYEGVLLAGFMADLKALGPDEIFLDSGSGAMRAVLEYLQLKQGKARAIGINPVLATLSPRMGQGVDRRFLDPLLRLSPYQFLPLFQKTEDVTIIPEGSISLMADFYGAMAYSKRPDLVLYQLLKWLKVGGKIYIVMSKQSYISQGNDNVLFTPFLDLIQGIHYYGDYDYITHYDSLIRFCITKTATKVSGPKLKNVRYFNELPPLRVFEVEP